MSARRQGRKASLWTPANIVTCVRIVLVPLWLLVAEAIPYSDGAHVAWGAFLTFALYLIISLTDKLDGYLARSRNEVTTFGKFLDPIADKLAVVVALAYLLETGMTSSWVLLVIVAREFLVSGLRMVVASKGTVVAASNLGKFKTATTMVAICGYLFAMALPECLFRTVLMWACNVCMLVAVVLTIWSGVDYFVKSWPALTEMDE